MFSNENILVCIHI